MSASPLGEQLAARRKALGIKRRALAKTTGIDRSRIARLEEDASSIKLTEYKILCKALKMRVKILT